MSKALSQPVLALNANWQVVDVYSGEKAMSMIYSGAAVPINIDNGALVPTKWNDWKVLAIGENDDYVKTLHGDIRLPRVVIAVNYKHLRPRKMTLNNRNLAKLFGFKCGYTGEHVPVKDSSMDHLIPKSKGGKYEWRNAVYTSKKLNNKKGDKTIKEAGLKLVIPPFKDPVLMPSQKILIDHGIKFPEWGMFLKEDKSKVELA